MPTQKRSDVERKRSTAFVGLGSNLGDSRAIVRKALDLLESTPEIDSVQASSLYVTAPVGFSPDQPVYTNGAARIQTTLSPHELLTRLQEIELELGRKRKQFWGSRTIDLDLLLYDSLILNDPTLTIPHPRMHWRLFVLDPMIELAPGVVIPTLRLTIRETREVLLWNYRFYPGFVCLLNETDASPDLRRYLRDSKGRI